jgi:hypothetical protein
MNANNVLVVVDLLGRRLAAALRVGGGVCSLMFLIYQPTQNEPQNVYHHEHRSRHWLGNQLNPHKPRSRKGHYDKLDSKLLARQGPTGHLDLHAI